MSTIVCHTAEGATSIESLGSWFQNPSAQVSSHVGIDDKPNTVGEYVRRQDKAWTQANANPWCVSAELCGWAAWSVPVWQQHPQMLANLAAWIAEEAAALAIPIVRLSPAQAQNPDIRGVCQHSDLGTMGGNHSDCGPGFSAIFDQILEVARGGPQPQPEPPKAKHRQYRGFTTLTGR